jgi:membrane protease YdiL (CAAX protease family)
MRVQVLNLFWNSQAGRLRAIWRLLGQFALFLMGNVLAGIVGALAAMGWLLTQPGSISLDTTDPAALVKMLVSSPVVIMLGAVTSLLATAVSMWLAAHFLDRRTFSDFGFHLNRGWWLDLGFGLALGALLMAGIFLAEWAAGWVTITGVFQTADPDQPFALAILSPIAVFLCIGIYEEMLSRGYLLHNLAEGLNFPAIGPQGALVLAWLLSSAIFGLGHANNPNTTVISTINLILAGIFLGLGYALTGELAISIGLHITWNFFQGNAFGFPVSGGYFSQATFIATAQGGPDLWTGGNFGPEAGLLGIIAMVLGSLLVLLWVRSRYGRIALHTPLVQPPVRHPQIEAP